MEQVEVQRQNAEYIDCVFYTMTCLDTAIQMKCTDEHKIFFLKIKALSRLLVQ